MDGWESFPDRYRSEMYLDTCKNSPRNQEANLQFFFKRIIIIGILRLVRHSVSDRPVLRKNDFWYCISWRMLSARTTSILRFAYKTKLQKDEFRSTRFTVSFTTAGLMEIRLFTAAIPSRISPRIFRDLLKRSDFVINMRHARQETLRIPVRDKILVMYI